MAARLHMPEVLVNREDAIALLWQKGQLHYQLHAVQEQMRADIGGSRGILYVINSSRRLGKSRLGCLIAVEQCLQLPRSQVRYAAPTAKDVRKIITPHMHDILADCPAHLRPTFNTMDSAWTFPNGSQIHVAGVNNGNADSLRGVASHLCIVDEAGFCDDLRYLVNSVLLPQTMTTQGRIVLLSTPPRTPAHDFTAYCARAELEGAYSRYTIHDAPHIDHETRATYCREAGGEGSTDWRREYLCEFVVDDALAVLPEFSRVEEAVCQPHARPSHYVPIIVGDVGYHDLSFFLFGYHDFRNGMDVIEAEYVTNKTVARDLVAKVDGIAVGLWGERKAAEARRFADAPAMVIAEMGQAWSGIAKTQTDGSFKAAAVNDVRTRLAEKSIRIAQSCEQLRAHCRYGVWRTPGRDLERMDGFGHFDGIDALTYLVRLVDRRTNPYPTVPEGFSTTTHYIPEEWNAEREEQRNNLRRLGQGARGDRR